MFVKIFICITLLAIGIKGFTTKDVEGPIVPTELGQVQGTIDQSFFNSKINQRIAAQYLTKFERLSFCTSVGA